jgi:hypothetical protein
MRRRIVQGFNQPLNPLQGGKAHSKDPRNFVSGNKPGEQWDIDQFAESRQALIDSPPEQYSQRHANQSPPDAIVRPIPTRITYVAWTLDGVHPVTLANKPYLLVPKNPRRLDITLSACTLAVPSTDADIVHFSWGKPNTTGITGVPYGNVLAPGLSLARPGSICPIDELWVWNKTVAGIFYCAFEGIEAVEGNQG